MMSHCERHEVSFDGEHCPGCMYEQTGYVSSSDRAGWAYAYGRLLHHAGRYEEAIVICRKALEHDYRHVSVHAALAACLSDIGDSAGASAAMTHAVRFVGQSPWSEAYGYWIVLSWIATHDLEGDFVSALRSKLRDFLDSDREKTPELLNWVAAMGWEAETTRLLQLVEPPHDYPTIVRGLIKHDAYALAATLFRRFAADAVTFEPWFKAVELAAELEEVGENGLLKDILTPAARLRLGLSHSDAFRKAITTLDPAVGGFVAMHLAPAPNPERVVIAERRYRAFLCFRRACLAQGRRAWATAIAGFTEAFAVFQATADTELAVRCLIELGRSLMPSQNENGNWPDAVSCFDAAAEAATHGGLSALEADAIYEKGWSMEPANNPAGNWDETLRLYKRAADLSAVSGNAVRRGIALHAVAWCLQPDHNPAGDWQLAAQWYETAIAAWELQDRKSDLAKSLFRRAVCLCANDRSKVTPDIRKLFLRAVSLRRKVRDIAGAREAEEWAGAS